MYPLRLAKYLWVINTPYSITEGGSCNRRGKLSYPAILRKPTELGNFRTGPQKSCLTSRWTAVFLGNSNVNNTQIKPNSLISPTPPLPAGSIFDL